MTGSATRLPALVADRAWGDYNAIIALTWRHPADPSAPLAEPYYGSVDANTTGERSSGEITRLLREASSGNKAAFDRLVPLVYEELHKIASSRMRVEPAGHTLTPTALVHEAYLQLVAQDRTEWHSRSHFFAVAALAMRRILVNYAKMKDTQKRGGGAVPVDLEMAENLGASALLFGEEQADELLALDSALGQLRTFNQEGADVVEYRFFGGLNFREIAEVLGVSEVTVRRRWTAARAWLRREMPA